MLTQIKTELKDWVDSMTGHFGPDHVHWCDGSEQEYDTLCQKMVDKGTFIKLNPESYYVNEAPVDINLFYLLLLNIGTIVVCLVVLLIPSYIITKITPSKSIRFE